MSEPDYDIIEELDRRSIIDRDRVRAFIRNTGKLDVLAEFDAKMREIDMGITGAQATWNALSEPQRKLVEDMSKGVQIERRAGTEASLLAVHPQGYGWLVRAATVRNLMERELVSWEAGRKIVLTERGRFVLDKGRTPSTSTPKSGG